MKGRTFKSILLPVYLIILTGQAVLWTGKASGSSLEEQRDMFRQARKELRAGRIESYNKIAGQLENYPLYPYLLHDYLSRYIWKVRNEQLVSFLGKFQDVPVATDLRRTWLNYLAKRNHWDTFVDNYTTQNDELLQCYYLHARMKTNRSAYLLEDIRSMWLYGKSRPPQCDAAFGLLYQSELMTDELVWQRIRLAMEEGQVKLAAYLRSKLKGNDGDWVNRWIAMYHNPWKETANPGYQDIPMAREILSYGIRRLAPRDINRAIDRWEILRAKYDFDDDQIMKVRDRLAVIAAAREHEKAVELLDEFKTTEVNEKIFNWRISTALKDRNWDLLLRWTQGEPGDATLSQRWYYWRARALEETGDRVAAEAVYRKVAEERDYYGFAASDRLGKPYQMAHRSLPEDDASMTALLATPALIRARELLQLNMNYHARREWHAAMKDMTNYQLQLAAAIAYDWGWYDRSILTMGKAQAYDDLKLRFPVPFEGEIKKHAAKLKLDLAWVYALIRAESAFMEDALSPAGARGLMQVMPATGKETARAMGWKTFKISYLYQSEKNINLGTSYLSKMYDRFNNNIILATAAYNAGPNRVAAWLPKKGCIEPEIWIERIPYTETRKYVSRILYYASIYDWRMQQEIKPVRERLAMIASDYNRKVADLSCPGAKVSMR